MSQYVANKNGLKWNQTIWYLCNQNPNPVILSDRKKNRIWSNVTFKNETFSIFESRQYHTCDRCIHAGQFSDTLCK